MFGVGFGAHKIEHKWGERASQMKQLDILALESDYIEDGGRIVEALSAALHDRRLNHAHASYVLERGHIYLILAVKGVHRVDFGPYVAHKGLLELCVSADKILFF